MTEALGRSLVAFALSLALHGCNTTRIENAWADPEVAPADLAFRHVVAIAALRSEATQRIAEDALAAAATRTRVTPAYQIVTQADRADVERLRTKLEAAGVDAAVVVRLVGIEEEEIFVPNTGPRPRSGYYDYWRREGARVYESGYYRTDTEVVVETRLYDVARGRLLWAGTSRTVNPRDVEEVVQGIFQAASEDLRKRGLVP